MPTYANPGTDGMAVLEPHLVGDYNTGYTYWPDRLLAEGGGGDDPVSPIMVFDGTDWVPRPALVHNGTEWVPA